MYQIGWKSPPASIYYLGWYEPTFAGMSLEGEIILTELLSGKIRADFLMDGTVDLDDELAAALLSNDYLYALIDNDDELMSSAGLDQALTAQINLEKS